MALSTSNIASANFHVELDQHTEQPVNFVQVAVAQNRAVHVPEQAVVDFIGSIFVNSQEPDLIVAIGRPASVFARKYRQQLFPDTPLLFAAVDERYLRDAPLGSIMCNAQALQMMVTTNRATPDAIGDILSDIQTQGLRATQIIDRHRTMLKSHQLDRKPIDLHAVIDQTLALVAHDMSARQVSSIVDAHGGTIVACNSPEGGATRTVTLRRSASTSVADALH